MQCDRAREQISPYLDGELAEAQARELGSHLQECPACAALLADYRRMSRQIRISGREPASEDLLQRVRGALAAAEPIALHETATPVVVEKPVRHWRQPVRGWLRQAAAIAAVCIVSVLATWFAMTERSSIAGIERDVLSAHVRALLQDSPVQVASSDQHTVRPWFTGRLEYAPEVRDLARDGFPLVGGRLDFIEGRRVGALVYRRQLHVINVFLWPVTGSVDTGPVSTMRNGYNMLHWTHGGVTYWAVSDLNDNELRQLQALL